MIRSSEASWYDPPEEEWEPEQCAWCLRWYKHPEEVHQACEVAIQQHMCHNQECIRFENSVYVDYQPGDPCEECGSRLGEEYGVG